MKSYIEDNHAQNKTIRIWIGEYTQWFDSSYLLKIFKYYFRNDTKALFSG